MMSVKVEMSVKLSHLVRATANTVDGEETAVDRLKAALKLSGFDDVEVVVDKSTHVSWKTGRPITEYTPSGRVSRAKPFQQCAHCGFRSNSSRALKQLTDGRWVCKRSHLCGHRPPSVLTPRSA